MREDAYIFRIGYKDTIRMMDLENVLNSTRRLYQGYLAEQAGTENIGKFADTVRIKSVSQGSIMAEVSTQIQDPTVQFLLTTLMSGVLYDVLKIIAKEVTRRTYKGIKEIYDDWKKRHGESTEFLSIGSPKVGEIETGSPSVQTDAIYEYRLVLPKKEEDSGLTHMKYAMIKKLFSALKNDVTLEIADQQGQVIRVEHDKDNYFKMTCNFIPDGQISNN